MKTTSVYNNETLYLLTAKSKSQRWKFAFACMAIASISTCIFGTHVFPFFRVHMNSLFWWAVLKGGG